MMTLEICQKLTLLIEKGAKVKSIMQDLEEIMATHDNLLNLSAIISRDWTKAVEVDDSYFKVYPDPRVIYHFLQGFTFQKECYDPIVGRISSRLMKHLAQTCNHLFLR